jgi:hypothetical protein
MLPRPLKSAGFMQSSSGRQTLPFSQLPRNDAGLRRETNVSDTFDSNRMRRKHIRISIADRARGDYGRWSLVVVVVVVHLLATSDPPVQGPI